MNTSLGQIGKQVHEIWKQLGINQRISIVLAAFVVIGVLTGLAFWSSRENYSLLFGKVEEAEAAKVIAALDDAKVPYRVGGGGSILVPGDKVHVMRMQLAAKGIPRGEGVGFEIFDKPNFGISDFVQRANYIRAVQGELARTISQVDSIEQARVMVVMPENRILVDQQKKPTASVFVRVRGNATLPPQTVNAIRFLVANAVEGLVVNAVTVVDNLGNVLSDNAEEGSMAGITTTQLGARKNLEQYLSKKAEGMLEKVLGPGQAVVRVSADLNFDSLNRVEEKYDEDAKATKSSQVTEDTVDTLTSTVTGGAPGTSSNSNTDTNKVAAAVPTNTSKTKKKVTNNQYEVPKTTVTLMQTPGGIKRLSAAVFVAEKYEGAGKDRKKVPQDLDKLKRIVQSALGIQSGDPAAGEISLEEMPFNDQPFAELTQKIDQQEKVTFWITLAQKGGYPLLAVAVLFVFWRMFKKTPAETFTFDIPASAPENRLSRLPNASPSRGGNGEVVTVEVLNQLIKENPNNMTQAIRTWMTRGKN